MLGLVLHLMCLGHVIWLSGQSSCPKCLSLIPRKATRCRFCQIDIAALETLGPSVAHHRLDLVEKQALNGHEHDDLQHDQSPLFLAQQPASHRPDRADNVMGPE